MNAAAVGTALTVTAVLIGALGLWIQLQSARRGEAARQVELQRQREQDMAAARGQGYSDGDRNARLSLEPKIEVLMSERDAAREQCRLLQSEHVDCERQKAALEREIRRLQGKRD